MEVKRYCELKVEMGTLVQGVKVVFWGVGFFFSSFSKVNFVCCGGTGQRVGS